MSKRYNCSNCKTLVIDTRRHGVNDLCTECEEDFRIEQVMKFGPAVDYVISPEDSARQLSLDDLLPKNFNNLKGKSCVT